MNQDYIQGNDLLQKYIKVRSFTEKLCVNLQEDDFNAQPVHFVSPPKWHLAHTTWFFEQFILVGKRGRNYFNDRYPYLFNSYYEAVGERVSRDARGSLSRPVLKEVFEYRKAIDENMIDLLSGNNDHSDIIDLLQLGLNHEQQHQEL
jgi:hypothetical protein